MGKLLYGTPPTSYEIDDRILAHLQVVMLNKFRRNEAFPFHLDASPSAGTGRQSLWLHPTIPLQFSFHGSRMPAMNPAWVSAMMDEANSGRGLRVLPESEHRRAPIAISDAA